MGRSNQHHIPGQLDLFSSGELPPVDVKPPAPRGQIEPAVLDASTRELGNDLPPEVLLGTSSWSFPGWDNIVYGRRYAEAKLAKGGLPVYAKHPLFRAVGIDRSFYAPVPLDAYKDYAESVPDDFRFLVKAPERLVTQRFPQHPRYGELAGQSNPDFLNPDLAKYELLDPVREGLGGKTGCVLFQFPPQSVREMGGPRGFATRLYGFLEQLPKDLPYAVELRNPQLFNPAYLDILERLDVCHCINIHPDMPDLNLQLDAARAKAMCVVRWMLNPRLKSYEEGVQMFEPFDRLRSEDAETRAAIARLCKERSSQGLVTLVIINNKAEGCSPLSVQSLARAIVRS